MSEQLNAVEPKPPPSEQGVTISRHVLRRWIVLGACVIVAAAGAATYWYSTRNLESTDDAFIDADVSVISSNVSGHVVKILVEDNQLVREGQPLLEVDPTDYKVRLDQAKATLVAAEAEAERTHTDALRYERLYRGGQTSQQLYDHAVADSSVAQAKVEIAREQVVAADLNLSYTKIASPISGLVTRRTVAVADFVEVGRPLMSIVPEQLYITANFKESQVGRMAHGQQVRIAVDAVPGHIFFGHVDSIQAGTGSHFSLLPPENATGNFVKVVQRVPVKILFDEPTSGYLLIPGMSVVPTVKVR